MDLSTGRYQRRNTSLRLAFLCIGAPDTNTKPRLLCCTVSGLLIHNGSSTTNAAASAALYLATSYLPCASRGMQYVVAIDLPSKRSQHRPADVIHACLGFPLAPGGGCTKTISISRELFWRRRCLHQQHGTTQLRSSSGRGSLDHVSEIRTVI